MLSQEQYSHIKQRLLARSEELRADIQRELHKHDNEEYIALAHRVSDPAEQSVADLLVDVTLAEISRDVAEFRDIEAALLRLAQGTYGICLDCEDPVSPERLDRNPAASRCLNCQQAFEEKEIATRRDVRPSL